MAGTVTEKLIEAHLVEGDMTPGGEIGIRIDQTLTQDATGTLAMLELDAMVKGAPGSGASDEQRRIIENYLGDGDPFIRIIDADIIAGGNIDAELAATTTQCSHSSV